MNKSLLHHPDVSLTVIRRGATDVFLDCLTTYAQFAVSRGRSVLAGSCFSSDTGYRSALCRLRKAGVIACRSRNGGGRVILLTGRGYSAPVELRPDRLWNTRWDGLWRVLVYDVKESERKFRDGLRRYLSRLRMGYLQDSVWISPRDMRPAYADLQTALNVQSVSFLFESRTVLSRESADVVLEAWDFDRLGDDQRAYVDTWSRNAGRVRAGGVSDAELGALVREEMLEYTEVMRRDPLLPRELLPKGYVGVGAYAVHQSFVKAVKRRAK